MSFSHLHRGLNCGLLVSLVLLTSGVSAEPHAANKSKAANKQSSSAEKMEPAARSGTDRLDLDTTTVTGNRELPKVQYIVPWKRADAGDLPGQPLNTLLDEALAPVDREVFRREVDYYKVIANKDRPAATGNGQ